MSSEGEATPLAPPRRLHGTSVLFGLGPVAKTALSLLVLLLVSGKAGWQTWALVGIVPGAIQALLRYFTLTYELNADALVIRQGLFSRSVRTVPYSRIQHVELIQGPLQRLCGVAEVSIEGAGGGEEPEATLRVVSNAEADVLRARLEGRAGRGGAAGADVVLRLTRFDLVLSGLTEGRGWLVVGALVGGGWELGSLLGLDLPTFFGEREIREGVALAESLLPSLGTIVLGILGMVVLFRLLSVAWAFVTLHDFTLTRDRGVLRSHYGLLTRYGAAIPGERVQLLTIIESPLLRLAKRAAVKVQTAARFAEKQDRVGSQWLAPIVERRAAAGLVREVLPGVDLDALSWQPLAAEAERRWRAAILLVLILCVAGPAFTIGTWGIFLVALAVVWGVAWARGLARHTAYSVDLRWVALRTGWLTRRTTIVPTARIQVVRLAEDVFDRRWRMASIAVDTAGSGGDGAPSIPFLLREEADRIFAQLFSAAANDEDRSGVEGRRDTRRASVTGH